MNEDQSDRHQEASAPADNGTTGDRKLYVFISAIAGIVLSFGAFSSSSDILFGAPFVIGGVTVAIVLWRERLLSGTGFLGGFLVGLNGAAILLLVRPPCKGVDQLLLEVRDRIPETSCREYDDMTGLLIAVVLGSVAIIGLLLLLRKLGRRPVTPEVDAV